MKGIQLVGTYKAGAVSAKITLDTEQFEKAVSKLKQDVETIKQTFNTPYSNNGLTKEVETLKKEIESLHNTTNDYKRVINDLRKTSGSSGFKEISKEVNQLKEAQTQLNNTRISPKGLIDFQNNWHRVSFEVKRDVKDIKGAMEKFAGTTNLPVNLIVNEQKLALQGISATIKEVGAEYNRFEVNLEKVIGEMSAMTSANENLIHSFHKKQQEIKYIHEGYNQLSGSIVKTTEVLHKFNFKLLEGINKESIFYQRTVELASAMHRMNSQGAGNWQGRNITGGYSNYISQSTNILKKQREEAIKLKIATGQLGTAYNKNTISLNTYKSNISNVNKQLDQQRQRVERVKQSTEQLQWIRRTDYLSQYKANMNDINRTLERQIKNQNTYNNSVRSGQRGMREFGTRMGKAEAYSNNLYRGLQKVRSVIVSFKTILGAMGGMAVWNFVFDIVGKAKETYTAKNEMESLLKKNSKVNTEGIQLYNKALDQTITRFQKINKYSLGETAAAIGLEFNLNAKQMSKSLEVIGMIQSEYVRAGRTTEEAALAVKDILQGEFMRLSRETGVGKEELKDYGWSGDNKDITSLMTALKKAATDRHWDLFAEKATSLNDVITITQNRFGELGSNLISDSEPMIVGAFNTILDVVTKLRSTFEGMDSFSRYFTIMATSGGIFWSLSTALMMLKRNMGLSQIATIGWGKSFWTALLGLKQTDVATHGFWKTLVATTSGTETLTVANIGLKKSIAARLLGVKHTTVAEHGLINAMVQSKAHLRGEALLLQAGSKQTMSLAQKFAYLTNNMSAVEAEGLKTSTAIRKIAFSTKLLRLVLISFVGMGILTYFASIGQWADSVKKRIETYNDVLTKGKDQIKDAESTLSSYETKLSKLSKTDVQYDLTKQNRDTAKHNISDLKQSLKLAKQIKKEDKEISKAHDLTAKGLLNNAYTANGVKNVEKYGQKYQQIKQAAYDIRKSEDERYKFEYKSLQHINERTLALKQEGVSEKDRVKYITEYSAKAEEAAEHLKKFNQGDINEGIYFTISQLQLLWIDLWNNSTFINFWRSVQKTWSELLPTLKTLYNGLLQLGIALLKFFSTDIGRWVGTIGVFGAVVGVVALKIGKWITGTKSSIDILKKLGKPLVDRIRDWRNYRKEVEKTGEAETTTTGGVTGGTGKTWKSGEFKKVLKDDFKNIGRNYAKLAVHVAGAMLIVMEAILLMMAPMGALAVTGVAFEYLEPNIRKGINGLKLIAPVVLSILVPVIAIMAVMDKFGGTLFANLGATAKQSAMAIAVGLGLVSEAIGLLVVPMAAIAVVGYVKGLLGDSVEKGKQAISLVTNVLVGLYPIIPVFIAAIYAGSIAISTEGIAALVGVGSIAIGMGLVAVAVLTLSEPLLAIGTLGGIFHDLTAVRKGSEAIKVTAEALKYVESALVSMATVKWSIIANAVTDLIGVKFGVDLSSLTKERGFFDQLNDFMTAFDNLNIKTPNPAQVEALNKASTGLHTVTTALTNAKKAIDSIPPELKNPSNLTTNEKYQKNVGGNTNVNLSNYFDQLKEPLRQLSKFISDFNSDPDLDFSTPISPEKINAISSAANMLTQVNNAVTKVRDVLGNSILANGMAGVAGSGFNFGGGAAIANLIQDGLNLVYNSSGGSGGYKSSLGSSFQSMEDIISDLSTFSSNISGAVSSDGKNSNVESLATFVSSVSTQIGKLVSILNDKIPEAKNNAKSLGAGIVSGVKQGLTGISKVGYHVVSQIAHGIMVNKESVYKTSQALGNTVYLKFKKGVDPMSKAMGWELFYVGQAIDANKSSLGEKSYSLSTYMSDRFKDGLDMHSPGIMARSMQAEVGYIGDALRINNLPQMAFNLANSIGSNFKVNFGLTNIQLPNLSDFTSKLSVIPSTVNNVKAQVTSGFNSMRANISGAFNNILIKTRTSMGGMLSATTRNIGAIRTSWRGMQNALISSAEHIRQQTGSKINNLKTNMANFWKKIQNPSLLMGSAGGHTGTINRARVPKLRLPSMEYAGGFNFKPQKSKDAPDFNIAEYIKCMMDTGKSCYAGGWNFNWNSPIQNRLNRWNTHFGKFHIDDHVKAGKFYNNNFPVRGVAEVAKAYIFDTIRATQYGKYFNSKYGEDPISALNAGVFNCWDGTNIILSIAKAFGFSGSRGHGTWNGIGHVWANIPGLGIIDPTAIQRRGSFTSSAVKGYSAGSISRSQAKSQLPTGDTVNHNEEVHIHLHGDTYGIDDLERKIEEGAKKVQRKLFTKSLSGV